MRLDTLAGKALRMCFEKKTLGKTALRNRIAQKTPMSEQVFKERFEKKYISDMFFFNLSVFQRKNDCLKLSKKCHV